MTMQYEILQESPFTNVILVFGGVAQSRILTDKNRIARHDVGLCKHVAPLP